MNADMESTSQVQTETDVYDVVIVGAGPVGLAVAARIREDTPAAIFTDEEHRRYQWLRKYGKRVSIKQSKSGKETRFSRRKSSDASDASDADSLDKANSFHIHTHHTKMIVVDESDSKWLGRWDRLFGAYGITHLRSPLLWHVDPQDRDSLLARAHEQGNPDDLFDVGACVGKEVSKHLKKKRSARRGGIQDSQPNIDINERDRNDYFTPSRKLFYDHCNCVRDRYGLDGAMVRQETLRDVDYGVVHGISIGDEQLFTVTTNKTKRYARTVVLAVGPANVARIPWIPGLPERLNPTKGKGMGMGETQQSMDKMMDEDDGMEKKQQTVLLCNADGQELCPQATHTFHISRIPDVIVEARVRARQVTNVLVIGGGLTSAQVTDLCLRRGVTRVWHLMRGDVVVKYFDVDLSWMGKYKNREQARFWAADSDEERWEIIKEARGGGSVTPHFNKILKKHVASGRVQLRTRTRVTKLDFVHTDNKGAVVPMGEEADCCGPPTDKGGYWQVTTEPAIPEMPLIDYIYFATGIETHVDQLPYLQTMLEKHPVETVGGFPCLTDDLMWTDDVPLFCAGKLACLRIGPASPNLGGAKLAAERIGLAVDHVLRQSGSRLDADSDDEGNFGIDYANGTGSKYKCLVEEAE